MTKRRNPRDVVVSDVKRLRQQVRDLTKLVKNEVRYRDKKFVEHDRAIYDLQTGSFPMKTKKP